MIKFWSYNRELKKYKKKIHSKINKSLNSGQIFLVMNYLILRENLRKKMDLSMVLQ